ATRRSSAAAGDATASVCGEPDSREHHRQQPNPVVLFAEAEVLSGQQPRQLLRLGHPRTGAAQLCLLGGPNGDRLFELLEHSDACRSWFVGNRLLPASSAALIATEMDPVFPLLPLLLKDLRYRPLDEACHCDEFPDTRLLLQRLHAQLPGRLADSVCDVRPSISSSSSLPLVRLNLDRCLGWLEAKLRRIAAGLRDIQDTDNEKETTDDNKRAIILACSLLADYLPWQLTESLASRVGIDLDDAPVDEETASASAAPKVDDSGKRSRREKQEPLENYALPQEQQAPVKAVGTRKPALRKEAGMQSITNFFAKSN
ncbi:hypothetical protein BOX15_Mlig008230g3, partial [Macrostomum lignano]